MLDVYAFRQVDRAAERAIGALHPVISLAFIFVLKFLLALDQQHILLYCDLDFLRIDAGQFGGYKVRLVALTDVYSRVKAPDVRPHISACGWLGTPVPSRPNEVVEQTVPFLHPVGYILVQAWEGRIVLHIPARAAAQSILRSFIC